MCCDLSYLMISVVALKMKARGAERAVVVLLCAYVMLCCVVLVLK